MAKTITKKSSKSTAKTPAKAEAKIVAKSHSKSVAKNIKTPKAKITRVTKVSDKAVKDDNCMAYFWGGLGIVLCAAGALIVLLWGIGAMLNK